MSHPHPHPAPAHPSPPAEHPHPAPAHPAPAHPTPAHPTPAHPAPAHPTPAHPAPAHPAPAHPTPGHPAPAHPTPGHPAPAHPAPGHPAPGHPAPGHPSPPAEHQTCKLYVIQEGAGEDGCYHWKLLLANAGATDLHGVWYDVVWSPHKDVGMQRRGPKPFEAGKSRAFIKAWPIGDLPAATAAASLQHAVENTRTPQYTVEDHVAGLNCQTWVIDVVEKVLGAHGVAEAKKVPREE